MSIDITGFSFSSISTFKSCPRAFKYKYIKKLPEAFNTIEAFMGGCVHETLEWAYNQRQLGYEPTLQMALEQYNGTWNSGISENIKVISEDKTRGDYFSQGRECIAYFLNHVFPHDKSTTLYLELKFEIPLNEEILYRGVIDRISKGVEGTLRVTDYKTGKVEHPLENLQLPSYAMYIFRNNIDLEIELCFEDLREQRTVVVPYNRKEVKKVREELLKEIEQIRNTAEDDFITRPSILCLWCGYNTICDNPHESVKRNSGTGTAGTGVFESRGEDFQEACPLCGGRLQQRKGKFGLFWGCSNFPRCRYTLDTRNQGSPAKDPDVEGKDICPECGSLLKRRKGKYGAFMGCSAYPECRFTRPI
jgi:RecB family exonuclease